MKKTDFVKTSLVCLFAASTSYGAGFALYQGSAAGNADFTSGMTKGGEPGSLYLNPASITTGKGTQIQFGIINVAPSAAYKGQNPYTGERYKQDAKNKIWPIPHAYVTHQINDDWWLGLGLHTRFGLGSKFDENWFGRYNNYHAEIVSFNINPVVAWKANDWLSLSAGLTIQYFDITLKQKIDAAGLAGIRNLNDPSPSPYDIDQSLEADDVGIGANLGIMVKPVDKVNLGVAYHSRIKQKAEGRAKYTKPAPIEAMMPTLFNNTDIHGRVTLPDMIMSAVTYDFTDKLTVGVGLTYTAWSTYDELKVKFDNPIAPGKPHVTSQKDWDDAWRYILGATYAYDDALTFRTSYTFDQSPMNSKHLDYIVPGDDRHIISFSAGYKINDWTIDLFYFYELIEDQKVAANVASGIMPSEGVDTQAHSFGFSVTKAF